MSRPAYLAARRRARDAKGLQYGLDREVDALLDGLRLRRRQRQQRGECPVAHLDPLNTLHFYRRREAAQMRRARCPYAAALLSHEQMERQHYLAHRRRAMRPVSLPADQLPLQLQEAA